ncbi:MAG TPA: hypothetical protein VNP02_16990 [Gammaproteobacteria bacterium]|nr:hypothetical protein [Gammaproteobacteria bacterium]
MTEATVLRAHLTARFEVGRSATLDGLVPLYYERPAEGLPAHVRSGSALRRFENWLVIVQDDVQALAVRDVRGAIRPVLLPPHASGQRVFDDTLGNKREKLDLEACVVLPDGRLVAFGSGSLPAREQLVVWRGGNEPPILVAAGELYRELRATVVPPGCRLNIEGAVISASRLVLFHRGNDTRIAGSEPISAIAELDAAAFSSWLGGRGPLPVVTRVTTVDLGTERNVPYSFTDAVALDDDRIVVLACAEAATSAIDDGVVLGCRVGLLAGSTLTMVDVHEASGNRTTLKLEGIERRPGLATEFDVSVDVDEPSTPALLGRLTWEWR